MTDGTAAISSTAFFRNSENQPRGKYSPRNIATANEKGMEMIRARKDVIKVPIRKGSAPYVSLTGSHVRLQRYLTPRALIEGMDWMIRVIMIPSTSRATATAIQTSALRKKFSHRICLLDRFVVFAFALVVAIAIGLS